MICMHYYLFALYSAHNALKIKYFGTNSSKHLSISQRNLKWYTLNDTERTKTTSGLFGNIGRPLDALLTSTRMTVVGLSDSTQQDGPVLCRIRHEQGLHQDGHARTGWDSQTQRQDYSQTYSYLMTLNWECQRFKVLNYFWSPQTLYLILSASKSNKKT